MDQQEYEKVLAVKRAAEDDLLKRPGVHGVGIGYKHTDGEKTDQIAIVVHVIKKLHPQQVPKDEMIPAQIDGVFTDVEERPQMKLCGIDRKRYRPLQCGSQIRVRMGGLKIANGTAGVFVRPVQPVIYTGTVILSCEHVLKYDAKVFQPSDVKRNLVGITAQTVNNRYVDAGIALCTKSDWENTIVDIGKVNGSYEVTNNDLRYPVQKRGRTTQLTYGEIYLINYSVTLPGGSNMVDQFYIESTTQDPFAEEGDSGSAVLNMQKQVVGLLWGGVSRFGTASPIKAALNAFLIEMKIEDRAKAPPEPLSMDEIEQFRRQYFNEA